MFGIKKARLLTPAALIFMAACIPLPKPPANPHPTEEKGFQIFMREGCFSSCHVKTLALARPDNSIEFVPDLRNRPKRTRDWYLAYLINTRAVLPYSPMPSYGYLSNEDLDALIAFLQGLHREKTTPTPEPISADAIPETPRDLGGYSSGRALYRTYCSGCHGESGDGGGPVGHLLSPEPRNFTDVIWMSKQTELYLFSIITDGKPNTAMPPFKEILSLKERALVIRYVQFFADPVARERMELGFVLK